MLAAASVARTALGGGRSDRLLRLFDYLLDRTLAGEVPSEQQIAMEAFNDNGMNETAQDANVRVYVHRLRKILDNIFAEVDGPKLHIPVGEYSLRLTGVGVMGQEPPADEGSGASAAQTWFRNRYVRAGALVTVIIGLALLLWWQADRATPPLATTLIWQPFNQADRPLVIVIGDYYLFAQNDNATVSGPSPQLVWDEKVPTREDLTILQILEAEEGFRSVDYNQQYVSAGTIEALSELRMDFAQIPLLRRRQMRVVAASQLTPEMLKSSDIIYVGQFSGMPLLLRDSLAQVSAFRIEPGFAGLTDKATAIRYQSDGMVLTDERIARRDFAYLAGMPGPAGNRLMVIAGLGDPGLKQAAQLVGNLDEMRRLKRDRGRLANGFEALYRVRTIKSINVGAMRVMDRPLQSGGMWDNSGNVPAYRPFDDKAVAPQAR